MEKHGEPEPWLRGTLTEVPSLTRAVLHALQLAHEDVHRWCGGLTLAELNAHPAGLPSLAFQVQHISGSLHRLLTYAEGEELSDMQLEELAREQEDVAGPAHLFLREFDRAMEDAVRRVRALARRDPESARSVGRKHLPVSLGGLLVHMADHTQRHVGQLITTAKVLMGN